jgi:hypothetical protein
MNPLTWAVGSWRSTGPMAGNAPRTPAEPWKMSYTSLCSARLSKIYGPSTGAAWLSGAHHAHHTHMTDAPPLALATFFSEIWETRCAAIRRTTLKQKREDDDDYPPVP